MAPETGGAAGGRAAEAPEQARTTSEMLAEEYRAIWGELPKEFPALGGGAGRAARGARHAAFIRAYQADVLGRNQAALCLSGGGIRSAAFALGVIQALADKNLLARFHYLSTVSGGGYIGGWLSRWIQDEATRQTTAPPGASWQRAAETVQAALKTDAPPVSRLREFTNFLTPDVGVASVDTWTGMVLYLRNVLMNMLVFVPALMLAALAPNLVVRFMDTYDAGAAEWQALPPRLFLLLGCFAFGAAAAIGCRYLPSHRIGAKPGESARRSGLTGDGIIDGKAGAHVPVIILSCLWALLLTLALGAVAGAGWVESMGGAAPAWVSGLCTFPLGEVWLCGYERVADPGASVGPLEPRGDLWLSPIRALTALVWGTSMLGYCVAGVLALKEDRAAYWSRNLFFWALASVVGTAILVGGVCLLWRVNPVWQLDVLATAGPLWVIVACTAQASLYAGIRRPRPDGDDDREWIARVTAVCLQLTGVWAFVAFSSLMLGRFLWDDAPIPAWISAAAGVVSTALAALGGGSPWSMAGRMLRAGGAGFNAVINVATAVGIAALLALLSRVQADLAIAVKDGWLGISANIPWQDVAIKPLLAIAAALLLLLYAASRAVDVNRFSMHGMYRNRLARAFLGSARDRRQPHPFTGFDADDNPRMWELAPADGTCRPLFPVVNVALNLTSSRRLAWQERKAMSFTISPLGCGSADLNPESDAYRMTAAEEQDPCIFRFGAYVRSRAYGGPAIPDRSRPANEGTAGKEGISLATAMTISGAAASPNMGYHSTPATALLMTLLNVRLGAWLANPARSHWRLWRRANPRFALLPLLAELFGQSDERGSYVYLSDGGHFDNLGLYEMVRRRCRFIVVSDAGCDPNCTFDDLGGVVRKCMIDHNVAITFEDMRIATRDEVKGETVAFAIGTVHYSDTERGKILYIKPTYLPDLPVDVVAYGSGSKDFPHESTGDQWFSESQFESYRRLGFEVTAALGGRRTFPAVADFFDALAPSPPG